MKKIRVIARIDINNDSVVKGRCLEGLKKIGNPQEMSTRYYKNGRFSPSMEKGVHHFHLLIKEFLLK